MCYVDELRKKLRITSLFMLVISLLVFDQAYAYSVGNHKELTAIAIKVYNQCDELSSKPSWFKVIDEVEQFRLIDGSYSEDEDYFDKSTNWHFYDRQGLIGRESIIKLFGKIIAEPTMHPRFNQLEINTNDLIKIKKLRNWQLYEPVGKIIHYLQDVTVPAHVVPIFHPFNDGFGDSFDDYLVNEKKLLSNFDASICMRIMNIKRKSYNEILDLYANETFSELNNDISGLSDNQGNSLKWNIFWSDKLNLRQFGKYGVAGNQFGDQYICIDRKFDFDEDIDEYYDDECYFLRYVEKDVFNKFANNQHMRAINATLDAIALLQKTSY